MYIEVGVVTMYSDVGVVTNVEFGPIITLEIHADTCVVLKNYKIALVLVIIHALWPVTGYSSYYNYVYYNGRESTIKKLIHYYYC